MKIVFDDPQFSYQLLRVLGRAVYGGADIGESLSAARRIKEGDFESWYSEWFKTAERIHEFGDKCLEEGRIVSAREAWLRASGYYRAAEFYLHGNPNDPRIAELSEKSLRCFAGVARLSDPPVEHVEIPYEGTTLPGFFYSVDRSDARRPLAIVQTGFDGVIEELHGYGLAAIARNMNCLTFEGPGQGRVIRAQGLPFRPDWEKPVTAVLDYVLGRPDVAADKIALVGLSFGGYLAPRAAAFENRLAACVANGGVYSFIECMVPPDTTIQEMLEYIENDREGFDYGAREAAATSSALRWGLENGMFTFKADSPSEYFVRCAEYTLENIAEKIICPTLVVDSEGEEIFRGQAVKLYSALRCPKEFMLFTAEEGAEEHCQVGASQMSNARILDWVERTLAAAG